MRRRIFLGFWRGISVRKRPRFKARFCFSRFPSRKRSPDGARLMTPSENRIGLFPATMLVAGNMIGAGIFMMPTTMASIGGIASLGWLITAPGAFIMGYMFARLGKA